MFLFYIVLFLYFCQSQVADTLPMFYFFIFLTWVLLQLNNWPVY